jgi:hypothetical protein
MGPFEPCVEGNEGADLQLIGLPRGGGCAEFMVYVEPDSTLAQAELLKERIDPHNGTALLLGPSPHPLLRKK